MNAKNLLVLCNTFPDQLDEYIGGIFIKDQLIELSKYYNKIYVLASAPYGIEFVRKTHHKNYNIGNINVYFVKYLTIPIFYYFFRFFWMIIQKNAIISFINKEKLDFQIIHAHYTWPNGRVAIELKKEFNVPVIITEHTSKTFTKVINKRDSVYLRAWKECDAIIRVKKGDLDSFIKCGIPTDKIFYIPNGFDDKKFFKQDQHYCRRKLDLPINRKIILNVANFYSPIKGHKYLINAMVQIKRQNDDIQCYLIGGGKLFQNIKDMVLKRGLSSNVIFEGPKSHDEIPLWINACDVFVLPSLNEGNPTVLFEVLGCGKPFVGTKVGGIPDIIMPDENGFLVNPSDERELAINIVKALNKKWDSDAIEKYAEQFKWVTVVEKILTVHQNV